MKFFHGLHKLLLSENKKHESCMEQAQYTELFPGKEQVTSLFVLL